MLLPRCLPPTTPRPRPLYQVPDYFSAALMAAGGAMLLVALVGCCSCGCCQVSAASSTHDPLHVHHVCAARAAILAMAILAMAIQLAMAIPWLYHGYTLLGEVAPHA